MARTFDIDGRVGRLKVSGAKYTAQLAEVTTKASVDISSTQVTQLTLELIEDADFSLLRAGLFKAGTPTTAGTRVDLDDLRLEVRATELRPLGEKHALTVTARTAGVYKMKRARGVGLARSNVSPTTFAAVEVHRAGLKFVGEPSPKRPTIARAKDETTWDVLQRLATELGYLCWEVAGTVYFGRPTWFVARQKRIAVKWKGRSTDDGLLALPGCRRSGDDNKAAATLEIPLLWDAGAEVRPGYAVDLSGVPTFDGRYMVDAVRLDLGEDQPVSVTASTPINPTPQPPTPDKAASGSVSRPKAGKYGGTPFDADQLGNALTIYRVGKRRGLADRAVVVALAVALQESTLRNLNYGDRDSLGVFQQRASWGSAANRRNVEWSAGKFYDALVKVRGWSKLPVTVAAQRVQVSAFPSAYAKWQPEAEAILAAIKATAETASSTGTTGGRAKLPVPSHPKISYGFGERNARYEAGYHTGRDYGGDGINGRPVVAVLSGRLRATSSSAYGTVQVLEADNGRDYWYCHLSRRRGSGRVKAGEVIGYVGSTGNTTGPHLHLEDRPRGGKYGSGRDPSW